MESASKLKILAKPKILALDNQPALIKISTQAAIGTTTTTAATAGGSISSSIERSEVGTILRVTPLINTGDRITLTLEPTFATVDKSSITVSSTVGETGDPTVRTARTTMMVNDGQTIAIGGLLLSQQANGNRKVPFFGNLPVIGKAFFTSNTKTLQDRELILFVTPYIIRDPSMLETPSVPDDRMRYENEIEPFWKVKQKSWYKQMKEGPPKAVDFDSYFNVRNRLMNETLGNLEQSQEKTS
jgi:general secretion pathway protein D